MSQISIQTEVEEICDQDISVLDCLQQEVESTKDTRIFRDKNFVGFETLQLSNVYQIWSFEFQIYGLSNAFKEFKFHCSGKFLGKMLP